MNSTSNSITWKTWSQKWGEWNTWYPVKVDKNQLNPSSRIARKAEHAIGDGPKLLWRRAKDLWSH